MSAPLSLTCSCGKLHTPESWTRLPWVGEMASEEDDGTPIQITLRNCPCGSTRALNSKHDLRWCRWVNRGIQQRAEAYFARLRHTVAHAVG